MAAASLLITPDNAGIGSIHKEHFIGNIFLVHIVEHMDEGVKKFPAAGIHHEHDLAHMVTRMFAKFHKFGYKDRRQIIHHEIA